MPVILNDDGLCKGSIQIVRVAAIVVKESTDAQSCMIILWRWHALGGSCAPPNTYYKTRRGLCAMVDRQTTQCQSMPLAKVPVGTTDKLRTPPRLSRRAKDLPVDGSLLLPARDILNRVKPYTVDPGCRLRKRGRKHSCHGRTRLLRRLSIRECPAGIAKSRPGRAHPPCPRLNVKSCVIRNARR